MQPAVRPGFKVLHSKSIGFGCDHAHNGAFKLGFMIGVHD
jgi:hypothetical protein